MGRCLRDERQTVADVSVANPAADDETPPPAMLRRWPSLGRQEKCCVYQTITYSDGADVREFLVKTFATGHGVNHGKIGDRQAVANRRIWRIVAIMNALSPIVSEFETDEQAKTHDLWLRAKVADSLADSATPVSHDEAMAKARDIIEKRRGAQSRLA